MVTKPEVIAVGDITPYGEARLIGMVASYVPFNDMAISQLTGQPRIMFQENSGLGRVIPVDAIEETVTYALKIEKAPLCKANLLKIDSENVQREVMAGSSIARAAPTARGCN